MKSITLILGLKVLLIPTGGVPVIESTNYRLERITLPNGSGGKAR